MTAKLQFDFLPDRQKHTITIRREFAAQRQLVWDCHTKSELLDRWFAPKPFTTKTKSMEFREGGHWHYAMVSPDGSEYWGYTQYTSVRPIDGYDTIDGFSDESGTINPDLPQASWTVRFEDAGEHTIVHTRVRYESLEGLEQVLQMGMQEGMTSTLEKLDELLATLER